MKILYDGWPLARQPNSPAALHLLAVLAHLPPEVEPRVALPAGPAFPLPDGAAAQVAPAPDTPRARLLWEQRGLPRLAGEAGADLLHLMAGPPALFGSARSVVSPCGYGFPAGAAAGERGRPGRASAIERLGEALEQGGLVRARGLLWPADLPDPGLPVPLRRLPPLVPPGFHPAAGFFPEEPPLPGLPEAWVLYGGPSGQSDLRRLLEAWTWAAGALGEGCPLLLAGLEPAALEALPALAAEYSLGETVRGLPPLPLETLAGLYRGCAAVFHPAPASPWGSPLRLALACARPLVGLETPQSDALAGPAAYLVPDEGDEAARNRALGAALLTVVVEESVTASLSEAARRRAAAWGSDGFAPALLAAYRESIK